MARANDPIRLSQRQAQIIVLTAKSLQKVQICSILGISKKTLDSHLAAISEKIGISTRPELTMVAISMGWVDNPYDEMAGSIICDHPPDV